jgi:hypothetical protein
METERKRRFRFSLRTFLVLSLIAGLLPWLYVQHRQWRERQLWKALDEAKLQRDEVLQEWRQEHAAIVQSQRLSSIEPIVREKYFAARSNVDQKRKRIAEFYGGEPRERPPSASRPRQIEIPASQ